MARPALSLAKKILFSLGVFVVFLGVLEGALATLPRLWVVGRTPVLDSAQAGQTLVLCAGDSVTFGQGLRMEVSYPGQLGARVAAAGLRNVKVFRYAEPASDLGDVNERLLPDLARLQGDPRLIVLLMIGHNDLNNWEGQAVRGLFGSDVAGNQSTLETDPRRSRGPRLFRIALWIRNAVDHDVPTLRASAEDVSTFKGRIHTLAEAVAAHRGRLVLLTYVVPGAAPSDMPSNTAQVLEQTRDNQRAINQLLRDAGAERGLDVWDLERDIVVPVTWSAAWFQDNIHWTEATATLVSDYLWARLQAEGLGAGR